MPHKLKSTARKSRRNKKIGIVASVSVLAIFIGVVAFYVFGQPVTLYGLLVDVGGSGSTNSTGTQNYVAGTTIGVQATANADWVFDEWLLNDTSVGSTNPYVVRMSGNFNLTAVFVELPAQDKVLLQTSMGGITILVRDDKPNTSGNFKKLVQEGTYDGTIFHRVIADFMIQGGDPTGTGTGDPSIATIPNEIGANNTNVRGTIAMANTGQPNSASSQFFINVVDNNNRYAEFDSSYTVFGYVIDGMDVADAISNVATDTNGRPLTNVTITKAEILP